MMLYCCVLKLKVNNIWTAKSKYMLGAEKRIGERREVGYKFIVSLCTNSNKFSERKK
jgi:hypothetical protein